MCRQLRSAAVMTIALIVGLGVVYPLVVTAVAQVAFAHKADGSLVNAGGKVVGSSLIGQGFSDAGGRALPQYFQPRPSATTANNRPSPYDPTNSGGSNLGPSDPGLLKSVGQRVADYRALNGLGASDAVPVDAVTASGSGLDPDISPANALDQVNRVAAARHLDAVTVRALVQAHRAARPWGFLGEETVNVLDINLALDRAAH